MPRKHGSKIPPKAQWPLIGALVVVFGAVLFWRFAPGEDGASAAILDKGIDALVSITEIQDLESLIAVIEENAQIRESEPDTGRSLERDPFVKARAFSPGMIRQEDSDVEALEYLEETIDVTVNRNEFLEDAKLTAIVMMGNRSVAVLDSKYLRSGDEIAGFRVVRIEEDHVVLKDEMGSELVRLEERWRTATEGPRDRSSISTKDGEL